MYVCLGTEMAEGPKFEGAGAVVEGSVLDCIVLLSFLFMQTLGIEDPPRLPVTVAPGVSTMNWRVSFDPFFYSFFFSKREVHSVCFYKKHLF